MNAAPKKLGMASRYSTVRGGIDQDAYTSAAERACSRAELAAARAWRRGDEALADKIRAETRLVLKSGARVRGIDQPQSTSAVRGAQ
jgi:hypothetical protein